MIVISGCPRSGTSMMMRIMEAVFGEDRILGYKDPTDKPEPKRKRELTELQKYIKGKQPKPKNDRTRAKDMNPNGYYEMEFSVRGMSYSPRFEQLLNSDLAAEDKKIVKIVSQGLAVTDPRYVDKVVFMARNPRAVAKSQERLGRDNPMDPETAPERDGKKQLIRSVSMYTKVSAAAARWIKDHPDVPVLVVNYDRLLDYKLDVMHEIQEFLGEGDFSKAYNMIDNTLRRSEPATDEGDEWTFADNLHTRILAKQWEQVIDLAKIEAEKPRKPKQWFCTRLNTNVVEEMCELCKSHEQTRNNFKKNAEGKEIDWANEPCVRDCLLDDVSIEDSIAGNHWTI